MKKLIVLAEHHEGRLKLATLSAVGFARRVTESLGGSFDILVLGAGVQGIAESVAGLGAAAVLTADDPRLKEPLADRWSAVVAEAFRARGADTLVGAASTFSKDILPRVAGLIGAGMVSDVVEVQAAPGAEPLFKRVMHAGNAIATVTLEGPLRVATVRSAAFASATPVAAASPVVPVDLAPVHWPQGTEFVSREQKASGRPDATEARVVVSGGRALKNAEDFERLAGGLADVLGAAVGSSRALVDSGITPNSLQIGQTGKVVAPEVYIALGISGAIQHLAGMKDSKVIVAINKDPDAPIFEVADVGLVADVYQAVPEMIQRLKAT